MDDLERCDSFDTVDWPREGRLIMHEATGLMTLALLASVERTRAHGQEAHMLAMAALQDHQLRQADLWIAAYRRRLAATDPKHRAPYTASERALIMEYAAQKGWKARDIAKNAVIDGSTARLWRREWIENPNSSLFTERTAWNSYDDALKDLVHRLRVLYPELDIGVRSIANYLLRAAICISPSSVRRLQNPPPTPSAPKSTPETPPSGVKNEKKAVVEPFHILKPKHVNHAWHADFTQINIFWMTFWVTSILDGFSRKLLALKVSVATPTTDSVLSVFQSAMAQFGSPRFAITDRGAQFRETFADLLRPFGIDIIHGPVKRPQFNGKCERFFRTLKLWQRIARNNWPLDLAFIQRCMDDFRDWYNSERVHQGVHGLTPDEAWSGLPRKTPVRYFARDKLEPVFIVQRRSHNGDPHLPVFDIRVTSKKSA